MRVGSWRVVQIGNRTIPQQTNSRSLRTGQLTDESTPQQQIEKITEILNYICILILTLTLSHTVTYSQCTSSVVYQKLH